MGIDVTALSPAAQAQITRKLAEQMRRAQVGQATPTSQPRQKQQKYHNEPTERAGIRFDSKKEARRFTELQAMESAGAIRDLRLQQDFTLQEGYTATTGERVRAVRYRADFTYRRRVEGIDGAITWKTVVEDVKSRATKTPEYIIKRKMMSDRLNIQIEEV